jgi:putative ABC transport system permease protein
VRGGFGTVSTLTTADGTAIGRECPAVAEVAWAKRALVQVVYGNANWSTSGQGVTPSYHLVRDWPLSVGRFFTEREQAGAAPVAVLGQTVVDNLFAGGEDPIGAVIRVKNVPFEVIGVLERKGQTTWGQDQDDVLLMPFSTAERRTLGTQILGTVDMIYVQAIAGDEVSTAEQEINELLRERHRIQPGEDADFTVRNLNEVAEASKMASQVMSNLLLSVASISLLVGGIGIMNIMLVSVTERTREIGIRMAVGARTRHILVQFLVEAIVVSTIGGLIGVLAGLAGTHLVARFAMWPTLVSGPAIAVAFSFSAFVGIVFGFYPAKRAAGLDPIAALRAE